MRKRAPNLFDMAVAVEHAAAEANAIVAGIKAGKIIGPSLRDIHAGAVDPKARAACLAAAAAYLLECAEASVAFPCREVA